MHQKNPENLDHIKTIIDQYDLYFIDLWGVIHNGVKLFDNAINVISKLKELEKKIVLISNAPRTNSSVKIFLEKLNFNCHIIDLLVTSGDLTQKYILNNQDKTFFHLGPKKDHDLFFEIKNLSNKVEESDEIICTGLIHEIGENIGDYENFFNKCIDLKVKFICANPDEVVSRGNQIEFCAGALAKYYKKLGGQVRYFGKPYIEIYEEAHALIQKETGNVFSKDKILAIGDNLKTDIAGAQNYEIDSVLILNGIYKDFFRDGNLNFNNLIKSNEIESVIIDKFQYELKW